MFYETAIGIYRNFIIAVLMDVLVSDRWFIWIKTYGVDLWFVEGLRTLEQLRIFF